jgi:hypothetical protein
MNIVNSIYLEILTPNPMEKLSDIHPDRTLNVADEATNGIMDFMRDVHNLDSDTVLDDMVYSLVHQYITDMMETTHTKLQTHLNS